MTRVFSFPLFLCLSIIYVFTDSSCLHPIYPSPHPHLFSLYACPVFSIVADITLFEFSILYFLPPLFHLSLLFLTPSRPCHSICETREFYLRIAKRVKCFSKAWYLSFIKISIPSPLPNRYFSFNNPHHRNFHTFLHTSFPRVSSQRDLSNQELFFATKLFTFHPPSGRQRFPKIHPEYLAFPLKSRRGNGIRVLSAPWKGAYPR